MIQAKHVGILIVVGLLLLPAAPSHSQDCNGGELHGISKCSNHLRGWGSGGGRVGCTAYLLTGQEFCGGTYCPDPLNPHYCYWCDGTVTFDDSSLSVEQVDCRYTATGSREIEVGLKPYEFGYTKSWCGGSEHFANTRYIIGIEVTKIEGPDTVCVGDYPAFTPITNPNPESNGPWACYYVEMDDGSVAKCSHWDDQQAWADYWCRFSSGTPPDGHIVCRWDKPGLYAVKFKCGSSEVSKTVEVVAQPDPETACGDGDGGGGDGGCGSGACPAGGPIPYPGNQDPGQIPVTPSGLGPGGCDVTGGCENTILDCGGTKYMPIRLCDGTCILVPLPLPSYPNPYPLGGLGTLSQNGQDPLTATYTYTDAAGNVTQMGPVPSDQAGEAVKSVPTTTYWDANGRATTFNREAGSRALNSVTLPNGDVWNYQHAAGDRKITRVTAPEGTTTVITRVPDVPQVAASGQISSVKVYENSGMTNLLSQVDYQYNDSEGRLTRATKNNLRVTYEYVGNKIIVTERSNVNPDTEIFGVTEYDYGGANSNTTTVTRKHATDPNKNEVTTYRFYTKYLPIGNVYLKTHLFKVTDPELNATKYSRYVGTGTDVALLTEGIDYKITSDPLLLGKAFKVTDAKSRATVYEYDETTVTGLLKSVTYPDTSTEAYTYYSGTSWLRSVKNVRGNWTYYHRNSSAMQQVLGMKISPSINGQEPTQQQWDAISANRSYEYYTDTAQIGLLKKEIVPDIDGTEDYLREYGYMNGARLEPGPTSVTYKYWNGSAYVNKSETTAYDVMGRVLSTSDANDTPRTIRHTYDKLGRQVRTIYQGTVQNPTVYTESSYSTCCGNMDWSRDEDNRKTYYTYDVANRVETMRTDIQPQGTALVSYAYDDFGNVRTVTTYSAQGVGRTTTYTYDKDNRVTQIVHPSPLGTEKFAYDEVGNLKGKMDGGGAITAYEYDNLNRLVKVDYNHSCTWPNIVYPLTADVSYAYYGGSSLKESMVEASLGTTYYDYDLLDRLTSYTPRVPGSTEVTYAYNNLNQKTSMTISGASPTSYGYYANGWLKSVSGGGVPDLATYTYNPVGNRTQVGLVSGTATTYTYDGDPRYRISEVSHDPVYGSTLTIGYSRDNVGNPTSIGGVTHGYDENSRLASAGGTGYTYDWVGNRNPGSNTYNVADELTVSPNNQYTYLGTGSLYQQKDSQGVVQKTFAYTPANLLSSVVHAGAGTSSMTWDADSNRVSFTSSTGGTTQFVYDPTAGIPAVIKETGSAYDKNYVREPDGSLVAMFIGSYPYYYHFDALGSTRMLTDETGHITDTYSYDAWGNASHTSGTIEQPYQYVGQLGYYTHYQDANMAGLLQLGVRFYDPQVGRFGQVDPLRQMLSEYSYAVCNPLVYVDPRGLKESKEDKAKKAIEECAKKCAKKCGADLKCWWPCMGKCLGDQAYDEYCPAAMCYLYPNMEQCRQHGESGVNPCEYRDESGCMWASCCEIQKHCCMARYVPEIGFGLAGSKCDSGHKKCMLRSPFTP